MENSNLTTVTLDAKAPQQTLTAAAPRPRPHRLQAVRTAERIAAIETLLQNVTANTDLAAALETRGYDTARLAQGHALRAAAQNAFVARQQAIGVQREAVAQLAVALVAARRAFVDYRITARSLLMSPADRARLDLDRMIPVDAEVFVSVARTSYTTALLTPTLAAQLSAYGYPAERLQAALAQLDAVATALHEADMARSQAQQATLARQVAERELGLWLNRFLTAARLVTRNRPDLRALLKVG
jgi:hypothetical protein